MAKRTYGEEERRTVERTVQDERVIEEFINSLDSQDGVQDVFKESGSGNVQASIEYNLIHPYDGQNFAYALMRDEEVAARVDVYVEQGDEVEESFSGQLEYNATDIFHPRTVAGIGEEEFSSQQPSGEIEDPASGNAGRLQAGTD